MKINTNFTVFYNQCVHAVFQKYIILKYVTSNTRCTQVGSVPIYIHAARIAERPKMLNRMLKHGKDFEPRMRGIHLQRTAEEVQTSADRARAPQAGVQAIWPSLTSQFANFILHGHLYSDFHITILNMRFFVNDVE